MKLTHAYIHAECCLNFLVRDEVKDKKKAFNEGKSWREYRLTIYRDNVELTFEWILWGLIKDEAYELLERLGVEWDRKETDENSFDAGAVYLYKDRYLVAKLTWAVEPH